LVPVAPHEQRLALSARERLQHIDNYGSLISESGRSRPNSLLSKHPWIGFLIATLLGLSLISADAATRLDGKEAPDFVLKTMDRGNLRLSEFRGQVVLINFWATWCGACRQAMPGLNDIYDKYQRAGLVMLSVNLDDESHRAMSMARSLNIKFPVLLDDRKQVGPLYQVETMPLTVLIDREGVVRFVHVGYNAGDEQKFVVPLRSLLNEQ
jgi:peroxiredoxin